SFIGSAKINGDNVALLKDLGSVGDAVNDLVIDGNASGFREAVVSQKAGNSPLTANIIMGYAVDFLRGYPRADCLPRQPECHSGDASRFPHDFQFSGRF